MGQAQERRTQTSCPYDAYPVLADLSGTEREGLNAGDLLQRFTELRYTIEFAVAKPPAA